MTKTRARVESVCQNIVHDENRFRCHGRYGCYGIFAKRATSGKITIYKCDINDKLTLVNEHFGMHFTVRRTKTFSSRKANARLIYKCTRVASVGGHRRRNVMIHNYDVGNPRQTYR